MKNAYEPKKSNVVTKCFVVSSETGILTSVDPIIYLTRPEFLGPFEAVNEFKNVFDAKKFINKHVQPGTRVSVAA